MKSTKKTLAMALLSMILCVAMLVGTTFAWFTDTASTGVNSIHSGSLDVALEYYDEGQWKDATGVGTLFGTDLWEPGHTEVVFLKVSNEGSLPLNYLLNLTPVNEHGGINVAGEPFKLSDYLVFKTIKIDEADIATYTREVAITAAGNVSGLNQSALSMKGNELQPDAYDVYALIVYMPSTVGNEANHKSGTTAPYIEFGITVVANQTTAGNNYSPDNVGLDQIEYFFHPQVSEVLTGTEDNGVYVFETRQEYVANTPVAIIKVPEDRLEDATKPIEFSVTSTTLPLGITLASDKQSFSYDINVVGLTDTTDNLVYVELKVPEGLINATVYHHEDPMTKATSKEAVEVATEPCFFYENGTLYLKTASFSPYTIVANKATDISVLTAADLQATIDAAADETIVLGASVIITEDTNIDLKGHNLVFTSHANEAFRVLDGTLIIEGDGTIDGSATVNGIAVFVRHGSAILNGGRYIGGVGCSCIYVLNDPDASVVINGGRFEVKGPWSNNGFYYVLNQQNGNTPGSIVVNGGTFINYDPSTGDDNLHGTFVGSGCVVYKNGDAYEVIKEFESGMGTEADPFIIATTEQLAKIGSGEAFLNGKYFALKNDIVASEATDYTDPWGDSRKSTIHRLRNATIDGRGFKITAAKDSILFGDIRNTTIKNLDVELDGVPMTWFAMDCTFDTVTTLGKATLGSNSGAFLIYPYFNLTMRDCANEASLQAGGAWGNYNAVFVGYGKLSDGCTYTFENCVNRGTLIGGTSSMFVGNISYGSPNIVISGCRNDGTIQATYVGDKYKFNMFVSVTNDGIYTKAKFTFDGESKTPQEMIDMPFDTLGGTWTQGPSDPDLKLTLGDDGKLVVTPSNNSNIATYAVSVGVYGKIVQGGSLQYSIIVEVPAADIATLDVYKLAFVDDTWVANNPTAVKTEHPSTGDIGKAYVTYVLDGVTYYLYDCNDGFATLDGIPKMATQFALSAYDANGVLIASTGLSN